MSSNEISGARVGCIFDLDARVIAKTLYEQFRKRDDCSIVSKNSGLSIEQVQLVKNYIFFSSHYNRLGQLERFFPSYDMAESWRRLSEKSGKNIKSHDITLLKHELCEISILLHNSTITQMEAHEMANKTFNYQLESDEYYTSIGVRVH